MSPSQPLDVAQCKASFKVEPHDEYPRVLQHIILTITHPLQTVPLAKLTAIHIRPYAAYGEFLAIMDSESDELQKFGIALFDRYGKIKSSLVDGKKGNGCWGAELNRQDIVYVLDMEVVPSVSLSSRDMTVFLLSLGEKKGHWELGIEGACGESVRARVGFRYGLADPDWWWI